MESRAPDLPPELQEELFLLTAAMLEKELVPAEHARLEHLLETSQAARRLYVAFVHDSTGLQLWARRHQAESVAQLGASELGDRPTKPASPALLDWRSHPGRFLAAAAALTCVFWLALTALLFSWNDSARPSSSPRHVPVAVAQLLAVSEARWSDRQRPLAVPTRLMQGQTLELESGLAEIAFDGGARVILQGPTKFILDHASRGHLITGRLAARLPDRARGFVVETALADIIDLGTEFGVEVVDGAEQKTASVVVFEGAVEVALPANAEMAPLEPKKLHSGQSLHIRGTRNGSVEGAPQLFQGPPPHALQFVRAMPQREIKRVLHWSFDEGQGTQAISTPQADGAQFRARLLPVQDGPRWITGMFGAGVEFDGRDDCIECSYSGVHGAQPRTVAFWAKIPRRPKRRTAHAIVSWGVPQAGEKWLIGWNPLRDEPLGAMRVEWGGSWLVGKKDLRDNRWHHLAVTFEGNPSGDNAGLAQSVRLYVDGKLEATSGALGIPIRTSDQGQLDLGYWRQRDRHFSGALDELYIFPWALQPQEIVELMHSNRWEDNDRGASSSQ